jgi:hypothetical protein
MCINVLLVVLDTKELNFEYFFLGLSVPDRPFFGCDLTLFKDSAIT